MMYRSACRSGSFCSKTLRLVWSRMTLLLMKQERSSLAGRKGANLVILAIATAMGTLTVMVVSKVGEAEEQETRLCVPKSESEVVRVWRLIGACDVNSVGDLGREYQLAF